MKTIVLDDDPTGTQSATGVDVLFHGTPAALRSALAVADAVYVQTNSRAIDEEAARRLVGEVTRAASAALSELGERGMVILRGDSTLRGHVFAEIDALAGDESVVLFAPAFPAGGRVTVAGVHYVAQDGVRVPAAETEYARDPVFPFRSSRLTEYVAEKSDRPAIAVPLGDVRDGSLAEVLSTAAARSVVIPDIEDDADVARIADAVRTALGEGRDVVVRCAAPLAAELARVRSGALLEGPLVPAGSRTLVVCGSHTAGATRQLERLSDVTGPPIVVDTRAALAEPGAVVAATAATVRERLRRSSVAVVATERERCSDHDTLAHGERVMQVLAGIVREVHRDVELLISKGGITAAEVAATGMGATSAHVRGQLEPGVSVWQLRDRAGRGVPQVIVPGNVGGPDVIASCLLRARGESPAPHPAG